MDMKNKSRHTDFRRKRKKEDLERLAAQLAPLEEQEKRAANNQSANGRNSSKGPNRQAGSIVVDNKDMSFPTGVTEEQGGESLFGIEPVVLVILGLMLAFIAFIAWQISLMPVP